jgi:glycosyltransferase involved in cell wall biosynthesis
VAIDDGSSDETPQLLADYATRDGRVRIVHSTGNKGQNSRIAELLDHLTGDYLAISDQDDRWHPARNARLFEALSDGGIALGRSELIDADGQSIGRSLLETFAFPHGVEDRLCALIEPMFSAHAMLMRRDALSSEALFQRLPFDWLIALEAIFGNGLRYRDDAVTYHRLHAGNQHNSFHTPDRQDRLLSRSSIGRITMFRQPKRLRLLQVFDFLGRSRRIDRSLQVLFRELGDRCHTVWFSEYRALRSSGDLGRHILDVLAPLASSSADLQQFRRSIAMLTGPAFNSGMRAEVLHRYRLVSGRLEAKKRAQR